MKKIELKGPNTLLTLNPDSFYTVEKGQVIVYAAPIIDGTTGRRSMMAEVGEGQRIPAMHIVSAVYGEWVFILSGLGDALLCETQTAPAEELIEEFAKRLKIWPLEEDDFAADVVEKVNLKLIAEEGYIYAVSEEQKSTYRRGLEVALSLFDKKKERVAAGRTGYLLYDTVAAFCDRKDIHIAAFDSIREACGRRFTIQDISRISHFICREVLLEENWYKHDSGSLIVYYQEENRPMLCVAKKPGKYFLIDCESGEKIVVTDHVASRLNPKGHIIYRPFENKPIGIKELFDFGIKSVRKSDVICLSLFALLGTLIGLLLPYLNEKIFDSYIPLGDGSTIVQICILLLAFTVGNLGFTVVKNIAIFRVSNIMEVDIQTAVLDRLFSLPSYFFGKYESADLAMRALGVSTICKMMSEVIISTVLSAVFSLLYLFRMFKYSDKLAWAGIVLILVNMIVAGSFGIIQIKYEKSLTQYRSRLYSIMCQLLNGIAKIRIAGVENRALLKYLEPYVESKKVFIRNEKMKNIASNINLFLGTVFTAIFYYMMISKNLEISFGEFVGFISAFGSFSAAMIAVVMAFLQVNHAIPIYQNAKNILEMPQEFEEDASILSKIDGKIDASNLSFRYTEDGSMVLSDLSFMIQPGEYIGVVGSSGSGKSTLLKILLGFEKPSIGKIYYDDQDIDGLDKRELRKRFGVVLQDGQLIAGSIYENITITGDNISMNRVNEVIRDVGLEQDIKDMPMGLNTVISEGAGTISGGQRQRILIARAIVNKPKIVFFDEATSALDNVTQAQVCESLENLNATRVVIAHRLSTVMNCDRILVLEGGKLIEQGTYESLMAEKGRFYDLAVRQLS